MEIQTRTYKRTSTHMNQQTQNIRWQTETCTEVKANIRRVADTHQENNTKKYSQVQGNTHTGKSFRNRWTQVQANMRWSTHTTKRKLHLVDTHQKNKSLRSRSKHQEQTHLKKRLKLDAHEYKQTFVSRHAPEIKT